MNIDLWIIFLTGLTVGGLTCLAVQGGLLASVIAARQEHAERKTQGTKDNLLPTIAFLVSKLLAYTLLGFFLGAFGQRVGINENVQTAMQFFAGFYMIGIACNLLNIHPIFRYFVIQPPRFLLKKVRLQSKSSDLFAPLLLGAMTIFIPCGTTLAMEALAISSAHPLKGAAIMSVFIFGTMPVFLGIGWLTDLMGSKYRTKFMKITAIALFYLGFISITGALQVGSIKIFSQSPITTSNEKRYTAVPDQQNITINITSSGYTPNYLKVKKNIPVNVTVASKDAYSCALAFRVPSLGISKNLHPTETYIFSFTPKESGSIDFTCSMGMYSGKIEVI